MEICLAWSKLCWCKQLAYAKKDQKCPVFSLLTTWLWWFWGKGYKREDSEVPFSGRNIVTLRFWAVIFIWPGKNSVWKLKGIMNWKSWSYVQQSKQNQCSGLSCASMEMDTALCRFLGGWTPRIKSSILGCSGPCWTISVFLKIFLSTRESYGLPLWPLPSASKSWGSKVNHTGLTDLQLSLETDLWF